MRDNDKDDDEGVEAEVGLKSAASSEAVRSPSSSVAGRTFAKTLSGSPPSPSPSLSSSSSAGSVVDARVVVDDGIAALLIPEVLGIYLMDESSEA